MDTKPAMIRTRLSAMMFIEFFLWASWYVPLGGYANSTLKLTGAQIGWLYATTAIAAMVSPLFVGFVADRLFATERVLGVLHVIGAVSLFLAAGQAEFSGLMTFLVINTLCFMPTLALANSLAFRNIDDREKFSRIAVWGTIGWIISGWTVGFLIGEKTSAFFYLAGAGGLAMAVYSFTALPHTPPKGREAAQGDVLGLGALVLFKDPAFLVFAVCAFLISIPLSFYFTWGNAFLVETDRPRPTALMTLCQFSEIFVMIVMPWFISRIGLKAVLAVGMAAWAVRYLCFATLSFPLIIVGLLVHGFCYCFVFVASFIYADKKAPQGMSASAQSLVAFLIWGIGMFVGTQLAGYTATQYPPQTIVVLERAGNEEQPIVDAPLPDWSTKEEKARLPKALRSAEEDRVAISIAEALPAESVSFNVLSKTGEVVGSLSYSKKDLIQALKKADASGDGVVTSAEWRSAQAHRWPPIWLWPAGLSALACALFWIGGRETKPEKAQGEGAPAS